MAHLHKKRFWVLFLSFSICLFACEKDKVVDPYDSGTSTALFNGLEANFKVVGTSSNGFLGLGIRLYDGDIPRIDVLLTKIPFAVGTYSVSSAPTGSNASCDLLTIVYDESKDDYKTMDSLVNELSITEVNTEKSEISGTYQLAFIRDTDFGPKEDVFPDTIFLTQGQFTTKYVKK